MNGGRTTDGDKGRTQAGLTAGSPPDRAQPDRRPESTSEPDDAPISKSRTPAGRRPSMLEAMERDR